MYKVLSLLSIVLFVSHFSTAQSYKKAFKALNNKEYTSARVQFAQAQKNPNTKAIGDFGFAVIQRSTAMRTEDMFAAYASVISARKNWAKCDNDVKKKNKDFVNEDIINKEFARIDKLLFDKVKTDGSSQAWEKFISECPQSKYIAEATNFLNEAAYNKAKSFNTIPIWQDFIKNYPDTKEAKKAQDNIYALAWDDVSSIPSVPKLESFIKEYPNSPKINDAKVLLIDMEYKKALSVNTDAAFASFISKYPDSEQAKSLQAKGIENDYENAVKFKTIALCEQFILNYPNSKYTSDVSNIRDSLAYLDALKVNTSEAYEQFIFKFPNAKQVPEAMSKMGNLIYSKAELKRLSEKNKIKTSELKSINVYQINQSDTSNKILTESKKYDIFGNCTYHFNKVTSNLREVYKYSYDDAGDKLLKTQYFVNDRIKTISYFSYNIKGQVVNAQIVCNFDCIDSTADYSDTMIYNEDRSLREKIRRNSLGKIVEQHKYTYAQNGNLVLENYSKLSNDSIYSFTTKYDYDGKGFLLQKTKKDGLGTTVSVGSYSYDGLGRIISSSFYDKIGTIYSTFFYDSKGILQSETVNNEDNSGKEYMKVFKYKH